MKVKVIGKIESINYGPGFFNVNVKKINDDIINIKMNEFKKEDIILGQLYEFTYQVEDLENEKQNFNCLAFADALEVLLVEQYTEMMDHFYEHAPVNFKKMNELIEAKLSEISNEVLSKITTEIYMNNKAKFFTHPAGTKMHHSYVGGLAYHTYTMLKFVEPIVSIYPYLNSDLLTAGIILHDMEKTTEISGVNGEYTKEGLLLGHISMGAMKVELAAKKFGFESSEEVILLKHMILSHHGHNHFGSPKRPQFGEALMLWFIDTIDSKFGILGETLADIEPGTWTNMIIALDKMRFYKPSLDKHNKEEN